MENESTTMQEYNRRRSDMSSVSTDCETFSKRITDQKRQLTYNIGAPDDRADAQTVNNNNNSDII